MSSLQHPPAQAPQVDLPPISVGRYLDLVRRRRWQVIPVSILGLIIGALVAFLIPRYYVAATSVIYQGYLDPKAMTREDPMAGIVASAEILIPEHVAEAIDVLGWEEGVGDSIERMAFEDSVRDRLVVFDRRREKGVTVAHITIQYSDTDGERSAALCNTVRDLWIQSEADELRSKAEEVMRGHNARLAAASKELAAAMRDLAQFERLNQVDSAMIRDPVSGMNQSRIQVGLMEFNRELVQIEGDLAELTDEETGLDNRLSTMQRMVPKSIETTEDDVLKAQQAKLLFSIKNLELQLKSIRPANPDYAGLERKLDATKAELQELLDQVGLGGATSELVPNKQWEELRERADVVEAKIGRLRARKAIVEKAITALEEEREAFPEIQREWDEKQDAVERADELLERIRAEAYESAQQFDKANRDSPMKVVKDAQVQAAPTDPNIYLVALAGSLVGLGAVVVLILLVDMLQSTFKTVGDVEHALAVPVLGTMAHMESDEARDEVARLRRRKTLVAGVLIALLIATIAVYYIDPTRLPVPVRQVLSLILTEPGGR